MLQRGLAILLSICMLTGGGNTVYTMSPQADVQTLSGVQSEMDIGDADGLPEDGTDNKLADERSGLSEDDGDTTGNRDEGKDSTGSDESVDNGTVEDGNGSGDTDAAEDGTDGTGTVDDAADDNGTAEDGTDDQSGTVDDATDDNGASEDGTDSDSGETEDDAAAGTGDDAPTVSDNDAPVGEDNEEDEIEVIEEDTSVRNGVSVLSVKEEDLTLTTDASQTVTLAEGEQQWLSFTAPEEGLYKFYSASEDSTYQSKYKYVDLYHEKTGRNRFDFDYGRGQNGNFNIVYRMQAEETVWLLVGYQEDSESGTFTVHAEKVTPPEFAVKENGEGDYTLQSDSYQLHLHLTPTYCTVTVAVELRQADGSTMTGDDDYNLYFESSYYDPKEGACGTKDERNLASYNGYKAEYYISKVSGKCLVEKLQLEDISNNILAMLGEGGQEIAINTKTTDKIGVLAEVSVEDTSIFVRPEMIADKNARIRYCKKNAEEWTYYKSTVSYWDTWGAILAAEPDTDYVIELTGMDLETVYDTAEVRTKAFAATNITTAVTDITSSEAKIKINIGSYTGSDQYINAKVSYVDSMGDTQIVNDYVGTNNYISGITLSLTNLKAGTEYKDLEVKLDDNDSGGVQYAAYSTKVSFTTAGSTITADKINVTVTPDTEDGTKAVLKTALQDVSTGAYPYTVKYRVAGGKDWTGSKTVQGVLNAGNSYTDERDLVSLAGSTEYEVLVMVDGITKTASFTTTAAAAAANVEVKPLMQGVEVKAALTGVSSGTYTIKAFWYDLEICGWRKMSSRDSDSESLTADNNWQSTAVFYDDRLRPNAENDWKIQITKSYNDVVYEKYMTLEAVRQEITLTAEDIKFTSARIRGKLAARDESIQYPGAVLYYRAKGSAQWTNGGSCSYAYTEGDTVYLSDLKEDTEYEVKLVPGNYPDDILSQITFQTRKDTRSLSVSAGDCRYMSAQINWTFDKGVNWSNDSYICIHYRKKGDAAWRLARSGWFAYGTGAYTGKESLTGLEPGTAYEVLAELKDISNSTAGADVVKDVKAEFNTLAMDHVLQAEPVTEATKPTSVTFTMKLIKPTGTLENRAKAEVTLTPATGAARDGEVFLTKENQYQAKLTINELLPNTKYTVGADLYESESNNWDLLKHYDLGEVTTAEAEAPTSLTISEAELLLNTGMSKELTVTVQPPEVAAGLIWTSSDPTVATVSGGSVTAREAGETDITVTMAGETAAGQEKVSAVCHVTVRDYAIRVKIAHESYDSIPAILSKSQKRTLVVYDNTAGVDLEGVTWTSSNPHTATVSETGLLEPQNYGKAYITAKTADNIALKTGDITVVNEIQGFSITRPETDNTGYAAVRTAEAVYQVAAGETYRVGCVLSPAYTEQGNSSVNLESSRFNWTSDNAAVSVGAAASGNLAEIRIPQSVSGRVKITAVMKDAEYQGKSFEITLDVLKKPEIETLPDTYTYLNYSNRLADAGLPGNWQWKQQDTLLYEVGSKTFTARYTETGYYPYETNVTVHARNVYTSVSAEGNYSTVKKACIVKTGTALRVSVSLDTSVPTVLYEQMPLAPAAKDAAKVSVSGPDANGKYNVTASVKGTYTISSTVGLKKAAFEKQGGAYVLKAGEKVKDSTTSFKIMAVDSAPVQKINFAVAADSPENVTISEEGTIEYEIRAANANTKQNERVIHLDVTAVDTDGSPVEGPKIDYKVSDAAVVKLRKVGTGRLVLTIPKGADGLAKITATAKDNLGRSAQLAVRVKDYTPRVTVYKTNVNENYTYSTQIAQVILPYEKDGNDEIEEISLVETNGKDGTDTVAGLSVFPNYVSGGSYKHDIYLSIDDKEKIKRKGNLNYYLAIKTQAYGGLVFVPVQIKLETGMPTVTLKQSRKVNVFYTDTTHITNYDAVSMGLVDVTASATIESVRWVAGDGSAAAANTEFVIENYHLWTWKNEKNTKMYMIQQHKPSLNSSKKPLNAAGTLYVRLAGYTQEVSMPFTIQTVYKKPKLKVADYKVCPALSEETDFQTIYTNAAKSGNWLFRGNNPVWRGYFDVSCDDESVEILSGSNIAIRYTGTKDKKTKFTLYSDYWYEPLTVPVKVKVAKTKVKLSTAAVTLNKSYPTETTQTVAAALICNAATGTTVNVSDIGIVGANAAAQQMLDQSLINMNYLNPRLSVSVNYAKAMGNAQFRPGSYKYKLTPYYGDTALNTVTLTVKIVDKNAAVKVRTKGSIDLVKLDWQGTNYSNGYSPAVTVTPTFQNLDSSYQVTDAKLCGAYKDCFKIAQRYNNGTVEILPDSVGKLKAGKSYKLSAMYTVKDAYGEGGETITVMSGTFTIKPKQSVPKVTASGKQLTLYASAEGYDKGETMTLYVPHDYKKGYYAIADAYGYLDVNKDGRADLYVTTVETGTSNGWAKIKAYVLDADAVKAAAKGTAYKIPVTVRCVGSDGMSKNASTTVKVLVKK